MTKQHGSQVTSIPAVWMLIVRPPEFNRWIASTVSEVRTGGRHNSSPQRQLWVHIPN